MTKNGKNQRKSEKMSKNRRNDQKIEKFPKKMEEMQPPHHNKNNRDEIEPPIHNIKNSLFCLTSSHQSGKRREICKQNLVKLLPEISTQTHPYYKKQPK